MVASSRDFHHQADAFGRVELACIVTTPAMNGAIGKAGHGVVPPGCDIDCGVARSTDTWRHLTLVAFVAAPADDRTVTQERHGVLPARHDLDDRVFKGVHRRWDRRFEEEVSSPSDEAVLFQEHQTVETATRDLECGVVGFDLVAEDRGPPGGEIRADITSTGGAGVFGDTTAALSGLGLVRVVGAVVEAVQSAVFIGVYVRYAAPAFAGFGLTCIVGAAVVAVGGAVTVGVGVRESASAGTGNDLEWVLGTLVVAVRGTVTVGVCVRESASAVSGNDLLRVRWTAVNAVGCSVSIVVGLRFSTTARTCNTFERIFRTVIDIVAAAVGVGVAFGAVARALVREKFRCITGVIAIGDSVFVQVDVTLLTIQETEAVTVVVRVLDATVAGTRVRLQWVIRTAIDAIRCPICVAVRACTFVRIIRTVIHVIATPVVVSIVAAAAGTGFRLEGVVRAVVEAVGDAVPVSVGGLVVADGDFQGPCIQPTGLGGVDVPDLECPDAVRRTHAIHEGILERRRGDLLGAVPIGVLEGGCRVEGVSRLFHYPFPAEGERGVQVGRITDVEEAGVVKDVGADEVPVHAVTIVVQVDVGRGAAVFGLVGEDDLQLVRPGVVHPGQGHSYVEDR